MKKRMKKIELRQLSLKPSLFNQLQEERQRIKEKRGQDSLTWHDFFMHLLLLSQDGP